MNIATAIDHIETALLHLGKELGEPVFDEWALVEKNISGWKLIEYGGTRKNDFLTNFNSDIASLKGTFDPDQASIGDFAFSHEGYGSGFDAHICAGKNLFVLFNNTAKSTGEITINPKWTSAQIHFSNLLDVFLADPLVA